MIKKSLTVMLTTLLFSLSVAAQAEQQLTLKIPEMTCQLCAYLVNKQLRAVDGVISTKANLKTQSVRITAQPQVNVQTLIQAVDELHYHAEVVE